MTTMRRWILVAFATATLGLGGLSAEPGGDAPSLVREAAALIEAGDAAAADRALRRALRADPDDAAAAALLRHLYEDVGHKLPVDEAAVAETLDQLGPGFRRLESRHTVVLSDCSADEARQRMLLVERTYHQFFRVMRRLGLEAVPPEHKLLCVLIRDHADYVDFARRHDGVEAPWVAGYYAALTNRVVMYDDSTGPGFAQLETRLREIEVDADAADAAGRSARDREVARRYAEHAEQLREHARSERERLTAVMQGSADAKAVHEAAHLIAFNCGLQVRTHQYPFWLTEGFATCFETHDAGAAFGPGHPFEPREREFLKRMDAGDLAPLRQVVAINDAHRLDAAAAAAVYAQSYALFRHLFRYERAALAAFFRDVQAEPAGTIDPRRNLELFEARFGDVDRVERAWLRREAG